MRRILFISCLLFPVLSLYLIAQETITKVAIETYPSDRRVRPFESMVLQLLVYGDVNDRSGEKKNVQLRQNATGFKILDKNGGWLSKPFLYQGNKTLSNELKTTNPLEALLGVGKDFVWQDSVLYTAPEKPGKYKIEVRVAGKVAEVEIEVAPKASSSKVPEKVAFPGENVRSDPYLKLAQHYAPYLAQETWFTPKADYLARFDYDGDWHGDNNWDDLGIGSSQAYVYYTAMETGTHWFVIYNFFHPRDYSDRCVAGTCHENDNEGLILTIAKEGTPFGRLQVMETLAHNNIYSFRDDRRIKGGVHDVEGEIEWWNQSHPVVFIESGGHGVYASTSGHSRFNLSRGFTTGTGVTYVYKGKAERPLYVNDREVGYELLPIVDQWWNRVETGEKDKMFDEYFTYQPLGGRPPTRISPIPGSFLGRKEASNKAKPFWGWNDNLTSKKKVLAVGQWGLDPAYAVSRNLQFPATEPFSLDYVFNPYLSPDNIRLPAVISSDGRVIEPQSSSQPTARPDQVKNSRGPSGLLSQVASLPELPSYRSKDYNVKSKEGTLNLRLYVDGSLKIFIQGDKITYEVENGRPPRENGSDFTQPLPDVPLKSFNIKKKDGRGEVQVVEQPSKGNQYGACLQINDPKGGEDRYWVEIKWKR